MGGGFRRRNMIDRSFTRSHTNIARTKARDTNARTKKAGLIFTIKATNIPSAYAKGACIGNANLNRRIPADFLHRVHFAQFCSESESVSRGIAFQRGLALLKTERPPSQSLRTQNPGVTSPGGLCEFLKTPGKALPPTKSKRPKRA